MTVYLDSRNEFATDDAKTRPVGEVVLRLERDFLSKVIDHMDTLLVVLDPLGRIIRFNRACERLFGYTTSEIRAKLVTGELPLPHELGTIKLLIAQIKAHKNYDHYESEWVSSSGETRVIAWSISFLYHENGELEYIFASGTDITRRKLAEQMLERERSLLHGLINSIPDLIFYKDCQSKYLGCNIAFEKFRGSSKAKIIGQRDADLYTPELGAFFLQTDRQVIQRQEAVQYENWTTDPDGGPCLIETRKTPYYGLHGEVSGVIGIGRDITKHRLAENALREAKLEIEQIISSLSSVLIVLTADLQVARWNPMAQEMFNISGPDASQRLLAELGLEWEWDKVEAAIRQCQLERRAIYPAPLRYKRPDGSEGFLGINISPMFDQPGQITGYILLGGDITQRMIFDNRLMQAQKLESIGQLAAGIAHEINTPIQYIGDNTAFLQTSFSTLLKLLKAYDAFLDAVRQGVYDKGRFRQLIALRSAIEADYLYDEVPLAIAQTLEGINRVAEIVGAMKAFSHPGVKEKTLLDLNQAIENTLTVTRNEWKYVASVETDFQADLPKVICLPGEINQVLLNILVNAAQAIRLATDTGQIDKGVIHVQTRLDAGWVEVRIRDNGPGIPEKIRSRIFEPFFTTKEVGKGTGQGLTIAYDVVERKHGGELYFETETGRGATFVIRLPLIPSGRQTLSEGAAAQAINDDQSELTQCREFTT